MFYILKQDAIRGDWHFTQKDYKFSIHAKVTFFEQPKNLETITGRLKKQEKETN